MPRVLFGALFFLRYTPTPTMTYQAAPDRYDGRMPYRRCGSSGLQLPAITLGLWHNFGDTTPMQTQREMLRTAFDLGITHFDLANNYGPPYGSAEINFGEHMRRDFKPYRDELIISSKAGWDMWPGPYGQGGGSRKYVLASLDQSLQRMGLDYVDIFYSHRFDPDTPLEETMGALATAVQQGKALYVGISSYSAGKTREATAILKSMGIKALIHQPSYSLLNRWIEDDLLATLCAMGHGDDLVIADANFPADSVARHTTVGKVLRLDGADVPQAVRAVLSVFPLDPFQDAPVVRMEVVGNPMALPAIQTEVQALIDQAEGRSWPMGSVERMAFYEQAKKAYAVIATSERRFYGCFILKKGVIAPEA